LRPDAEKFALHKIFRREKWAGAKKAPRNCAPASLKSL
jgi:hypothetical protein